MNEVSTEVVVPVPVAPVLVPGDKAIADAVAKDVLAKEAAQPNDGKPRAESQPQATPTA